MALRYGISKKDNVLVSVDANTTASRYPLTQFKLFRKFATRDDARSYKQSLRNPQEYVIVDVANNVGVR
ncbi:hypothetical protein [Xanthomonas phage DES1]|nr:hypothetical protein [Xanthomonas phage DES1]